MKRNERLAFATLAANATADDAVAALTCSVKQSMTLTAKHRTAKQSAHLGWLGNNQL